MEAGEESPSLRHTPVEKLDIPITSDDFDSLWSNLTTEEKEEPSPVPSLEFEITSDILAEADTDEQEQEKLKELRRIAKGGTLSKQPGRFRNA